MSRSYGFTIKAPFKFGEQPKNSDKMRDDFENLDSLCLTLINSNGYKHNPSLKDVLISIFDMLHKAHLSNKDKFYILK
jgi:hypothetical protein